MSFRTAFDDSGYQRYIKQIARYASLGADEERELAERWRDAADLTARGALVQAHLLFVIKVANKYAGYGIPVADLVAEGNLGLLEAVDRFDPTRGVRFISYAVHWIRAFILAGVIRQWSLVRMRISAQQSRLFFRLRRSRAQLVSALGDSASADEIDALLARRLQVTPEKVRDMTARLDERDLSIDAPRRDDPQATLIQLLPDGGDDQEVRTDRSEREQLLRARLRVVDPSFSPRERYILSHRLYTEEPQTLMDIGKRLRLSRERVRQIEDKIKRKLRRALADLAPEERAA